MVFASCLIGIYHIVEIISWDHCNCLFLKQFSSFNCFFKSRIVLTANVFCLVFLIRCSFLKSWTHPADALKEDPQDVNWKDAAIPHCCSVWVVTCCLLALPYVNQQLILLYLSPSPSTSTLLFYLLLVLVFYYLSSLLSTWDVVGSMWLLLY
jgi:hypothetical protein